MNIRSELKCRLKDFIIRTKPKLLKLYNILIIISKIRGIVETLRWIIGLFL